MQQMKYTANREAMERASKYMHGVLHLFIPYPWRFKLQLSIEIINGNQRGGQYVNTGTVYENVFVASRVEAFRRVHSRTEGDETIFRKKLVLFIWMDGEKYRYPIWNLSISTRTRRSAYWIPTRWQSNGQRSRSHVGLFERAYLDGDPDNIPIRNYPSCITSCGPLEHRLPFMSRSEQRSTDHLEGCGRI